MKITFRKDLDPEEGHIRYKSFFCWIPYIVGNSIHWLETVDIRQVWYGTGGDMPARWYTECDIERRSK